MSQSLRMSCEKRCKRHFCAGAYLRPPAACKCKGVKTEAAITQGDVLYAKVAR